MPLGAAHHLRTAINDGKTPSTEVLEQYEIPIIASVLKLYLLELPDSLVSSHVYEIIKTIYSQTATDTSNETRVSVIQSTLGQLRLANIATLDAITTHFTRLIELTSADETYINSLAVNLAPCVLRPRQETSLTMNEKYNYRLLRDLFAHKEAIFGELKRASSQANRAVNEAARPRGRGMSTDERGRADAEKERRQAILAGGANRSRAPSPAPSSRMKRERSPNRMSGDATTRFPVSPSTISSPPVGGISSPTERRHTLVRHSLEVPSLESSPIELTKSNGTASIPVAVHEEDPAPAGISKRDSLGRPAAGRLAGRRAGPNVAARQSLYGGHRDSVGSLKEAGAGAEQHGVQLSDKPMDD